MIEVFMHSNNSEKSLIDAMKRLDEDMVLSSVCQLIEHGYDKYAIFNLLDAGTLEVGKLFENGEYFIADLIVSGNIYADVINYFDLSKSHSNTNIIGTVLIGVVQGDIHEIGKDIICNHLRSEGFQVTDLGIDVCPERFLDAALKLRPDIIALSGIMANSIGMITNTIRCLEQAGVRDFASILIGGACIDEKICALLQADGWAKTPMNTLNFCLAKIKEKEKHG